MLTLDSHGSICCAKDSFQAVPFRHIYLSHCGSMFPWVRLWASVCTSVHEALISLSFLCAAKPQTSLRQPNHRGRGGNRGGGGCGRGAGHGDFRQARDVRDGQSESKPGGHPNKTSSQSAASGRKGNQPAEKWVKGGWWASPGEIPHLWDFWSPVGRGSYCLECFYDEK